MYMKLYPNMDCQLDTVFTRSFRKCEAAFFGKEVLGSVTSRHRIELGLSARNVPFSLTNNHKTRAIIFIADTKIQFYGDMLVTKNLAAELMRYFSL